MKTKLWLFLIIIGFTFSACEKEDSLRKGPPDHANTKANREAADFSVNNSNGQVAEFADFDGNEYTVRLIAGQHHHVGDVHIKIEEDSLYVTYNTFTGWLLTETHLHIAAEFEAFPFAGRTNNPAVGHFEHSEDHDFVDEKTYAIHKDDLPELLGDCYLIAAHAVVSGAGDILLSTLPEEVTVNIGTFPGGATSSYFENISITGGTFLAGDDFEGYCVESTLGISRNTDYQAQVFSSYDPDLPDIVDQPENLDKLNWLLNQGFVGTDAGDGDGDYTFRDMQVAIWKLIASYPTDIDPDGVGDNFSEDRVEKLLDMAHEYGAGYKPGCGDVIVLILAIEGAQNIIITYPAPCGEETAWGEGYRFTPRGNWAMYFEICPNN